MDGSVLRTRGVVRKLEPRVRTQASTQHDVFSLLPNLPLWELNAHVIAQHVAFCGIPCSPSVSSSLPPQTCLYTTTGFIQLPKV